jgi:predicted ATP-grasp superfamily ATP-dependent carboligase
MRLRDFELNEPLPELKEPHALAILRPWVDVGNVGTLTLSRLESYFNAVDLAKLAKPGDFFDFTRYRPTVNLKEGRREVEIPNTTVTYAKRENGHDFLFLRLLEPHMSAEAYIDSVLELLRTFGVKRYCLLGSMYDMVPYTRPLLVTGSASNLALQNKLAAAKVMPSSHQGPTTILYLIGQQLLQWGTDNFNLIVHLPNYLVMADDYRGERRLMEAICSLYDLALPQVDIEKATEQDEQVNLIAEQMIREEPRYKLILSQLEASYDSRVKEEKEGDVHLPPEIEKFLQDMNRRFRQG